MSPSEWTSQRNWRWTTALSQKDAFDFPLQVVLILVGLLPTSTNTLSVGTWLPRTTKVQMRKTNVITWPPFTRCAMCIATKMLRSWNLYISFIPPKSFRWRFRHLTLLQHHSWYLSREPRVYSCKYFLAGVNFYRFKLAFSTDFSPKSGFFFTYLTRKIGVFRCKFYSPKILPV